MQVAAMLNFGESQVLGSVQKHSALTFILGFTPKWESEMGSGKQQKGY